MQKYATSESLFNWLHRFYKKLGWFFLNTGLIFIFSCWYFTGYLHYAYITIDDKLEELELLNCYATTGNQLHPELVGSHYNLNPAANSEPIPEVTIEYPYFIDGAMISEEEYSLTCISGKTCKVVAIFGGR